MGSHFSPGTNLGRYEIRSVLGSGGMGEVYLAIDTALDRTVAIKILPAHLASDQQRLHRFIQEAKAASALNHPHIITIHEIGISENSHFIAMEFIDGDTLRPRIRSGHASVLEILDIAIQAAGALEAAHAAGIIHRDIKPENVMVRRDGYIKLLDFGLAKLIESKVAVTDLDASTKALVNTAEGTVIGTAIYMSPEQAKGIALDSRTDLWSLGVVLYEMVTGHVPFGGETPTEAISLILQKEPAPLSRYVRDVPAELERIVMKALTKNREERYQTAKDLLIDLRNLRRRLEVDAEIDRTLSPEFRATVSANISQGRKATSLAGVSPTANLQSASSAEYIFSVIKEHRVAAALAALLIALIAGVALYRNSRPTEAAISSIAVLPFENRSSEADTEYLSDGLAESLIYRLSQLPNLTVSPTSSVFRYKGKEIDPVKVGKELNVSAVLSGRISQRGEELTISAELVDVRHNKLIWGEQYNRKLLDLLATQREIAREIAERLKLKVSGADSRGLTKNYTESNEAYQLHLKGRYHFNKRTKEDVERAIEYFSPAINRDPNFALAYVGIADAYNGMPPYAYLTPSEAFGRAKSAARRALEIDPTLAEAHTALAVGLAAYDWQWAEAEREFKRALELNPHFANGYFYYAIAYLMVVKPDEAVVALKRALELDPLALSANARLSTAYVYAKQPERALEQARKTIDLEPNFIGGQSSLMEAYIANGMYDEAIALGRTPESPQALCSLGVALAKAGRTREAREVLEKFEQMSKTQFIISGRVARISAELGDREKTFALLERAFQDREWFLPAIKVDASFDQLRDDPRYLSLLRRTGLPG